MDLENNEFCIKETILDQDNYIFPHCIIYETLQHGNYADIADLSAIDQNILGIYQFDEDVIQDGASKHYDCTVIIPDKINLKFRDIIWYVN